MKPEAIVVVDLLGVVLIVTIYALLRARNLSIGLAAWWITLVAGLMVAISVPPVTRAWFAATGVLFQSSPFFIAFGLVLVVFLLYISVVISVLQRQVRDITQFIALSQQADRERREAVRPASGGPEGPP